MEVSRNDFRRFQVEFKSPITSVSNLPCVHLKLPILTQQLAKYQLRLLQATRKRYKLHNKGPHINFIPHGAIGSSLNRFNVFNWPIGRIARRIILTHFSNGRR